MKLYHVYDGDEFDAWFKTKAEALREAKALVKETGGGLVWVYLVDIGDPTLEKVRCCLEGKGFARSSEIIWTSDKESK